MQKLLFLYLQFGFVIFFGYLIYVNNLLLKCWHSWLKGKLKQLIWAYNLGYKNCICMRIWLVTLTTVELFEFTSSFLMSISSTFYARIFCTNIVSAAFLLLRVRRKSCQNNVRTYEKFARKTLMKLSPHFMSNERSKWNQKNLIRSDRSLPRKNQDILM